MTTYINEIDVMNVCNDLEIIVTPEIVTQTLEMFDDEMSYGGRTWEIVIQDLINELKTNMWLLQRN